MRDVKFKPKTAKVTIASLVLLVQLIIHLQTNLSYASNANTYQSPKDYNLSDEILESYNSIKQAKLKSQNTSNLFIFISFSMPDALILQYIEEAKRSNNNGILVLQGFLKDNKTGKYSIPKTTNKILQITNNKGANNIMINPELFELFQVKQVPSIVRVKGNMECIQNPTLCKSDSTSLHPFSTSTSISFPTFDKIQGSVSIAYALKLFDTEGESGRGKEGSKTKTKRNTNDNIKSND